MSIPYSPERAARRTILVVDDIEDNRVLLERFLTSSGYEPISVDSGMKAIAQISRSKPEMVLLDWMMPQLSGLETLQAIREVYDSVQLPVIMCTAMDEEMSVVAALNAGANDYIVKPISMPILRARMALHLKQQAIVENINGERMDIEQRLNEQTRILLGQDTGAQPNASCESSAAKGWASKL
jgi:DNA-binding response OmpR family regulator